LLLLLFRPLVFFMPPACLDWQET